MITIPPDEKILATARKHWFVLLEHVIVVFFFAVAGFVLLLVIATFFAGDNNLIIIEYTVLFLGGLVVMWTILFITWLNYYLDAWVLTEKRLFDIEQFALFSRGVSEVRLDKIQDISVEIKGLVRTFLDFGSIRIQTAGEKKEFIICDVPHPELIRERISHEMDSVVNKRWSSPNI
jgi:hypothetical protein